MGEVKVDNFAVLGSLFWSSGEPLPEASRRHLLLITLLFWERKGQREAWRGGEFF